MAHISPETVLRKGKILSCRDAALAVISCQKLDARSPEVTVSAGDCTSEAKVLSCRDEGRAVISCQRLDARSPELTVSVEDFTYETKSS